MSVDQAFEVPEATDAGVIADHPPVPLVQLLAGPSTELQLNTTRFRLIPIACFRVDDIRFACGSSFVDGGSSTSYEPHDIRSELALVAKLVKAHPGCPLSVFGHADSVGSDDDNKSLSGRRAMAIYGLLVAHGDPDLAVKLWQRIYATEKWNANQRQRMCDVTGCSNDTADETLIRSYVQKLCPPELSLQKNDFLAQGADDGGKGDYQGCGAFNPLLLFSQAKQAEFDHAKSSSSEDDKTSAQTANAENAPNRRVMVVLFRKNSRVNPASWPCPRVTEGTANCRKRFWSDGEERRSARLANQDRTFKDTKDTFACRFYQRQTDSSPCEGYQSSWPIDPFAWIHAHGDDLYKDQAFDLKSTTRPALAFGEGEHLELGTSMTATVDAWALAGLIEGGAMIDVMLGSNGISGPVDDWEIVVPDLAKPDSPYEAVRPLSKAHWHYIVPDAVFQNPQGGIRWTADTLRAAIKSGNAAVLSFGQLVFVGGDWVGSFNDLHTPFLFRPTVSLMEAVQKGSALAKAFLDVAQNGSGGYGDLSTLKDVANTGAYTPNQNFPHLLAAFDSVRSAPFGPIHLICQFMASDQMPLDWSEIQKHATWVNPSGISPDIKQLKVQERAIQILLTNGRFIDLALHNQTHFSPLNWDTFESGYSRALEDLRKHLATPMPKAGSSPIPASVLARAGFSLHYLTDAYSAGHMRVPRAALGTTASVAAKLMHDLDGRIGLIVANQFTIWRAYGDGHLHGPSDSEVAQFHYQFGRRMAWTVAPGVQENFQQAVQAVAEAVLLLHYYAQNLRVNGQATYFERLDKARRKDLGGSLTWDTEPAMAEEEFLGDNLAPTSWHFSSPRSAWLTKSVTDMLQYLRKHQPHALGAGGLQGMAWPNYGNNPPPLIDGNLNVDASGAFVGDMEGLRKHISVPLVDDTITVDVSDLFYLARFQNITNAPAPGFPLDTGSLEMFYDLDPDMRRKMGKPPQGSAH